MKEPLDPQVEIALLRGSLFLTARALKGYHDSRHSETKDGQFMLTVPESLRTRAADALERAQKMLRDEGRGR